MADRQLTVKQVILVRSDIGMPYGKAIAQGSHASMMFLTLVFQRLKNMSYFERLKFAVSLTFKNSFEDLFTPHQWNWISGSFTKVVLEVKSEEQLQELYEKALSLGLPTNIVLDSGKTHTKGVATYTCVAIGPCDPDLINQVTGHLRPYLQPERKK